MDVTKEDLERLMFFESAKEQAEKDVERNPRDVQALTRWGGALLEMAHFRTGNDATEMIAEAVAKFERALEIQPTQHDTLWCLGNAFTSQGFLTMSTSEANTYFDKAADCFRKAIQQEPTSEIYQKALEMTTKAPALHAELQRQLQAQAPTQDDQQGGSSRGSGKGKKASSSDFWWDVAGWVVLVGLGVGIVALARSGPGANPTAAPK